MDIIDGLTLGLELDIVVIEVSMNAVYVTILLDCILHELVEIGPKCGNGGLAVEGSKPHDGFVHERSNDFLFAIDNEFVVLSIGEQSCLGLFSEAVLQTVPHLFVVLCHFFVCIDACGKDERLEPCLECIGINLAVRDNEADLSAVLVCELENVWGPFVPSHHACPVL